jgi:hypothetical protein
MKKQNSRKRGTVVLSGFGAALTLIASNLAMAETIKGTTVKHATLFTQVRAVQSKVIFDKAKLCKMKDRSCLMAKPYVWRLSAAQKRQLRVLIGMNVQTDIKDACLVC